MIRTLYKTFSAFICAIQFCLSELYKKTLFKYLIGKIINGKVSENDFLALFRVF